MRGQLRQISQMDSPLNILKCKYCKTVYFVGTNLINMIE